MINATQQENKSDCAYLCYVYHERTAEAAALHITASETLQSAMDCLRDLQAQSKQVGRLLNMYRSTGSLTVLNAAYITYDECLSCLDDAKYYIQATINGLFGALTKYQEVVILREEANLLVRGINVASDRSHAYAIRVYQEEVTYLSQLLTQMVQINFSRTDSLMVGLSMACANPSHTHFFPIMVVPSLPVVSMSDRVFRWLPIELQDRAQDMPLESCEFIKPQKSV